MDRIFTPHTPNGVRLKMQLSENDWRKIKRGGRWSATVTDLLTGKRYKARGASCALPSCFCDAIATEVQSAAK